MSLCSPGPDPAIKFAGRKGISIIVCTFNRASMLNNALATLANQETRDRFMYEILIVDDGSNDGTEFVVANHQAMTSVPIRYLVQPHKGVAAARNRGVTEASGDWIAFFDDDQLAESTWLINLLETAIAKNADSVGGPCLLKLPAGHDSNIGTTIRRLLGEEPLFMEERNSVEPTLDPRKRVATPGTGNVLVRKSIFEQIGLFAENRTCGEDWEFFGRARRAGARFAIAPSAVVYHVVPPSRLTDEYLLRTAALGGEAQAEIDNCTKAIWHASLRLLHIVIAVIPKLAWAAVSRNRMAVLGNKCSARFSVTYIAVLIRRGSRFIQSLAPVVRSADET